MHLHNAMFFWIDTPHIPLTLIRLHQSTSWIMKISPKHFKMLVLYIEGKENEQNEPYMGQYLLFGTTSRNILFKVSSLISNWPNYLQTSSQLYSDRIKKRNKPLDSLRRKIIRYFTIFRHCRLFRSNVLCFFFY